MSLDFKSDDLFGGLSDSDDDARDEKLLTSSKQSIDLLQEMAISGSSNDDLDGDDSEDGDDGDDGDDEEEEKGEQANRPQLMTKIAPSKVISRSNSNSPEHPIDNSKKASFESSNENSNRPLNKNWKKRKFNAEAVKSEDLPDGLDALTSLIDSQPNVPKVMKRNSNRSRHSSDQVNNSGSVVMEKSVASCPSSSTPVENNLVLASSSAPPKELPNQKISAAQKTQELRQMEHLLILGNLSKSQLERYEVYRRSTFNKAAMKKIIERATGAPAGESLVLAIRSLAKMLVGELVEEAVELREARNETNRPLQPHHIKTVFKDLVSQGKLWPPYNCK